MDKLSELSKPVAYSLRFRNMNGEPDKNINANTTFSTLEKARAYGLGTRYVTLESGKIALVRDPSQDPIVEPLYSQEYVSALLAELEAKDQAHRVHAARLISERGVLSEQVTELEAIRSAAEKLVRCKGRYHSEQNYRALAALFGVTTPDLPPVEGDSEAVIAELRAKLATPVRLPTAMFCPEEYVGSLLWSETEAHNKAISKCAEALRAAGFKVEGDEQ